jgi:hypothetical protein
MDKQMGLCISKTGAICYDPPATQEELKERRQSASCAKAIALGRFKTGRHAFLAVTGDVQVGWCSRRKDGWYIEDMDCETLAGPFTTLAAASSAGERVLAHLAR